VLDAGRVAERGTHDELLAGAGRYAAMVERDAAPVTA
jgi:ATP-binding cassette, subfamily B, bacterial